MFRRRIDLRFDPPRRWREPPALIAIVLVAIAAIVVLSVIRG